MSQPVPTHWAGYVHSSPANTALPKGQWRPQTCPCLIPHFSQRFKKHPWLTAEEGVWKLSVSGPLCSLGQQIRERASAEARTHEPLPLGLWPVSQAAGEPCSPDQPVWLRKKCGMSKSG